MEQVFFKNEKGESLSGVMHFPDRETDKAVVLCHGWGATKQQEWIRELAGALSKEGLVALRFDRAGNGESDGEFEEATVVKGIGDTRSVIDFLETRDVKSVILIGHSLGGSIAVLAGAGDKRVKGVIAIAAPSNLSKEVHVNFIKDQFKKMGKNPDKFIEDSEVADVMLAAETFRRPLLVIGGTNDTIVDIDDAYELAERASDPKQIEIVDGMDHFFSRYEDEKRVVDLCLKFVLKNI